ncbi:hypothetical protein DFJ73DRAFT_940151, partial [Zopfochytrium polystomum]
PTLIFTPSRSTHQHNTRGRQDSKQENQFRPAMRFASAAAAVAATILTTTAAAGADSISPPPTQMSPACMAAIAALDNNVNAPCVANHPYPGTGSSAFGSPEEKEAYKCECSTPGLLGYSQAIVDSCDVIIVADIARYGWLDVFTAINIDQLKKFCGGVGVTISGTLTSANAVSSSSTSTIKSGFYNPVTVASSGTSGNSTATASPSYPPSAQTNLVSSAAAISPFAPILVAAVVVVASSSF